MKEHHLIARITAAYVSQPSFTNSTILALDEAAVLNHTAEKIFDDMGVPSALVTDQDGLPAQSLPELMLLLRSVCSKDLAFGLGYILTTFMAATNIWIAGSKAQQQRLAELLHSKQKISIAYHELDHGNDLAANSLTAQRVEGGYLLNGRKSVINNIERAAAFVLQARTDVAAGGRSHSLFFVDKAVLDPAQFQIIQRFKTQGVRSCEIAGIEFHNCFIPSTALLGVEGNGFIYALKAFQMTRALLPGASLGIVQHALNVTVRYSGERKLYGATVLDIPYVRATLAEAWLEFTLADSLSRAVANGLHVIPAEMNVLGSLCKFIIPQRMSAVLKRLALVLGSRYYLREGEAALFEKIVRDYPVLSLGHASSLTCQAALIPDLTQILRKFGTRPADSQHDDTSSLMQLFSTTHLPDFNLGALRLSNGGKDTLLNSLLRWPLVLKRFREEGLLDKADYDNLISLLNDLNLECETLCRTEITMESVEAFQVAKSYAWLQCAMAAIGQWVHDKSLYSAGIATDARVLASRLYFVLQQIRNEPFYFDPSTEDLILDELMSHASTSL